MNDIIKFLNVHYKSALKLVDAFAITCEQPWTTKDYLHELYVQLGHVYNVLFSNKKVNEDKRKIDNLGDELSDVLFQIINLAHQMQIDMYEIKAYEDYDYNDLNGLSILLGQLTEAVMEVNECRFKKSREGYTNSYEFIKDRLFKLFIITYNISHEYKLNMIDEFHSMVEDASNFLKRFANSTNPNKSYIDIYDKNENILGYISKNDDITNYWVQTFNCLLFNQKKNKVFLKLNNKTKKLDLTINNRIVTGQIIPFGLKTLKEITTNFITSSTLHLIERKKNSKNKTFQYYYALDLNLTVKDINQTTEEYFVELKLRDLTKLIKTKKKKIKAKTKEGLVIPITNKNLNNSNLEILSKLNTKANAKMNSKKINKMYIDINKEKKLTPERYYFDNGEVSLNKDYEKENIKYSVMKVKPNIEENIYLVYILIIKNNKSLPMLLTKKFRTLPKTTKYFNELCDLIEKNSNNDIIDKCYNSYYKTEQVSD